jgi:uncharacterized membrane protein YkoI
VELPRLVNRKNSLFGQKLEKTGILLNGRKNAIIVYHILTENDMKKSVKILIICVLIAALIAGGVIYLIFQTRDDDLLIGEERAQQIALNDAGLAANQVSRLKARIKLDDGVWCYKVTFRTIAIEYEYEIEAYSGAILEKDMDD